MNNKFSIIIPSLNSKFFLKQCIESILIQTYQNFEIIVVDGGSDDGTIDILKDYGNKIRWISEIDNGQAEAINKGISMCNGNWVTWQNCDDYYNNKDALSLFSKAINSNKSKKLFIGNINLVNFKGEILRDVKYLKPYFYSLLYEGMTLTNQACFWDIKLNAELGLLKVLRINFDYEWFLRVLQKFPNCGVHLNSTIGSFRLHKSQKTQNQNKEDLKNLDKIKKQYGFNIYYLIIFKPYLLIRKFFVYLFQGNFFYLLRGFFKFFFGKKNKEYIDS